MHCHHPGQVGVVLAPTPCDIEQIAGQHDNVLVAMSKALEAAEYLRNADERMGKLWREGKVRSEEYSWLSTVQE